MKNIILSLITFSFLVGDIQFSGDARFRPRYDIKENGDGSSTSDFYYMYRARLNMKADIGEGWFFKTQLGTNSVAGMTKMGILNEEESFSFNPSLSFMELYFGSMKADWGFWAGAFPLKYSAALDLHFYSDKLVDVPFVLFNNGSVGGFAGYRTIVGYKLNWFLSIDNNLIDREEFSDENIDPIDLFDHYTFGLDMFLTFGSVSVAPRLLTSFGGEEDDIFPMTIGADILLPKIAKFTTTMSYYSSIKGGMGDSDYYKADHMRLSLSRPIKSGKLKFFYDIASKDDGLSMSIPDDNDLVELEEVKDQVSYIWFSYTHTCYKGEMGEVTLSPTFRLQNGKNAGSIEFDPFNFPIIY